jgi:hypothetical protein
VPFDQPGRPIGVAGGQGMVDGVVAQPVLLTPAGCSPVQLGHPLRVGLPEAGLQQVGEQVVVAPPAALLVQGDQEQVGPLNPLQQLLAVVAATHCVTQRARQPLQHRGLQQELNNVVGLAGQDLLGQVVEDEAVAAAEGGDEAGRVGVTL